ncbi:Uncharacterised protein [Mycobacteroides abscessus]|nr:Uncharacterised protein [Mycobacteroides abscessus]
MSTTCSSERPVSTMVRSPASWASSTWGASGARHMLVCRIQGWRR